LNDAINITNGILYLILMPSPPGGQAYIPLPTPF
jgi:hypothetical protein